MQRHALAAVEDRCAFEDIHLEYLALIRQAVALVGLTRATDGIKLSLDDLVTELERTVAEKDRSTKGVMPGWMKGTIGIIAAVVCAAIALYVLFLLIQKNLLKRN